MKLAKKALVVVMALALIGCMSAMAFAAGSYTLAASEMDADGYVSFTLTLKGGAGTKSDDLSFTYDAAVLEYDSCEDGADSAQMGDVNGNSIMLQDNGNEAGTVKFSYLFQEDLSSDNLKAKRGKTVNIDPNNFEIVTFWFKVVDKTAPSATLTGAGTSAKVEIAGEPVTDAPVTDAPVTDAPVTDAPVTDAPVTDAPVTDAPVTDAPVTDAPVTDAPATDAPASETPAGDTPTEAPTNVAPVDTGDVPTGDNMALAAAAAVVVLAGAAFVITKKRK